MSSAPSPFDLLITDVVMPGLSGVEVARRAAERFGGTRVLYISGYTEDAIMDHGILQERTELLQKPFTATDLLQRVKSVLASPQT
jgi:YesN/AraC family two-component response regulator